MDACILKDLYENLDSLDKFVILVENNYDPDKKLLYELLDLIGKNRIIEYESLYLICDLVDKLLKQKNYKDDIKYFELAINTRIYEIIKLLISYKIKINNDELKCLNDVKNLAKIVSLMIENGYKEQIIEHFLNREIRYRKYDNELIKVLLIKCKEYITPEILNIIISNNYNINIVKFIHSEFNFCNFVTIKQYSGSHNFWSDDYSNRNYKCKYPTDEYITSFDYIINNNMLNVEKDFEDKKFITYGQYHISKILHLYKDKISKNFLFYMFLTSKPGYHNDEYFSNLKFVFTEFKFTPSEIKEIKGKYWKTYDDFMYKLLFKRFGYVKIWKLFINYGFCDIQEIIKCYINRVLINDDYRLCLKGLLEIEDIYIPKYDEGFPISKNYSFKTNYNAIIEFINKKKNKNYPLFENTSRFY